MLGMLMASIFITASMLILFFIVKDPPPAAKHVLDKFPPGGLALSIVVVAYPLWGVVGGLMGVLYRISIQQAPGAGIGSPNFFYTLVIVLLTVMAAAPFVVLLRGRTLIGVLVIALAFMGIFGWFYPYFVS